MNEIEIIEMIQKTESATFRIDGLGETTIATKELKFLIEAREKQIPKKPTRKECFYGTNYYCECGQRVNEDGGKNYNYCCNCGNHMDWSVEE